ncbi:MAG: sensor domain-containing diguanylate cyclase [Oscillospiraceae bacterium]|nr:sensor domain-containing diguanylate cyclase [Oscillospiraceae bacterium]
MKKEQLSLKTINQLKYSVIIGYAVIITSAILLVATLAMRSSERALKTKVSSLVSSLNVQMKLNLDGYLDRMETIAALAFATEDTYKYDATSPDNDEYDALAREKNISDNLFGLCIMDNFLDYGIVYRNQRAVGKISNGTKLEFGETMYEDLESMISNSRTRDGWAAGYHGNYNRIYYVKRIHENALMVISFYTDELKNVFDNPETMNDMTIRLLDRNYNILYSSKEEEIGEEMPADLTGRIQQVNNATVLDDDYLVTVNTCGDDWYVVCSIPTDIIMQEQHQTTALIRIAAAIAALLALLIGMIFAVNLTKPVERYISLLDIKAHNDQLTGILNKVSFEELSKKRIQNEIPTVPHALIVLDVDNFKGVNDTLGHAYGDEVLSGIGSTLRAVFSTEDYLGRIGGDEFCVLVNTDPPENMAYTDYIRSKCDMLCEAFHKFYTGDDGNYKISASIGCSFFVKDGSSFDTLYHAADGALYASKHRGKDTYTFAGEEANSNA